MVNVMVDTEGEGLTAVVQCPDRALALEAKNYERVKVRTVTSGFTGELPVAPEELRTNNITSLWIAIPEYPENEERPPPRGETAC